MNTQTRVHLGLLTGLIVLPILSPKANAIITRHDVPDADYVVADSDWPALVDLFQPGDCLATLITDTYLITVAHCAVDMGPNWVLTVDGTDHDVAEVILHPDFSGGNFDLALIRLESPVQGVTPFPLYRNTDEVGQTLTLVGRGLHATGLEGEQGGSMDQQLRRAENVVSNSNDHWLEVRFEEPTESGVLPLEGVGAAGDSGGPAFIETSDGLYIAGLNSWGDAFPYSNIGKYGAFDYSTRISSYIDWIDGIAGTGPPSTGTETGTGGSPGTTGSTTTSGPQANPDSSVDTGAACGCQHDGPGSIGILGFFLLFPWLMRSRLAISRPRTMSPPC